MHRHILSCKLTSPDLQKRKNTVLAELKELTLERVDLPDGIKLKFRGDDHVVDVLTAFIKTERLCCDFFEFHLNIKDENEFTWLKLTGPEGTKEFIQSELGL